MKRCFAFFSISMLVLVFLTQTTTVSSQSGNNMWAVIICGEMEFQADTRYLNEVLTTQYSFNDVLYLHPDAETNEYLNVSTVRSAITGWLGSRSDNDDLIFIFVLSHGGGMERYNATHYLRGRGIPWEFDGDEGNEVRETNIGFMWSEGYIFWGLDFNGNGIIEENIYGGIDECIWIQTHWLNYEPYWDDDVKADLDSLSYDKLIFFFEGCKTLNQSENGTCYSGGLIDDLSAPNRIIITSSNETSYSVLCDIPFAVSPYALAGYFSRPFINAINPNNVAFNLSDVNNDNNVSILEAFNYAYTNDPLTDGEWLEDGNFYQETPWLDDNGNGYPTFIDGEDKFDDTDGLLAYETYFGFNPPIRSPDINDDGIVDIADLVMVAGAFGSSPGEPEWIARCDLNNDQLIDIVDVIIVAINFGKEL
jgi:hypothetical protein